MVRIPINHGDAGNRIQQSKRYWWKAAKMLARKRDLMLRFNKNIIIKNKYIYYPLHVDPEASTMVLAPHHTDQLSVIEALSKNAPAEMQIVVKEHGPMLGMRPSGFYETIASMPRVVVVPPSYDGLDLIKKSALVVVITGTAGWEAMRLGVPVLIAGDSPYRVINEGFVYERCLSRFSHAIECALNAAPATDKKITTYLAAARYQSFDFDSDLLWGDYKSHSEYERLEAAKNFVEGTLQVEEFRRTRF